MRPLDVWLGTDVSAAMKPYRFYRNVGNYQFTLHKIAEATKSHLQALLESHFEAQHYFKENSHETKDCQKRQKISESPMTGPRIAKARPQFSRPAKNNKHCF
jgi:hypothetical protein